jgi:hypothetical protein
MSLAALAMTPQDNDPPDLPGRSPYRPEPTRPIVGSLSRLAVLRAAPILHILERSRFFGAPGEPRGRCGSGGRPRGAPGSMRGEVQIADLGNLTREEL